MNLVGDDKADRSVHGGIDKAVYAYAREDYEWWGTELRTEALRPGTFGENLTVSGFDLDAAEVGERWRVGSTLLEVSEPRFPCFKLGIRMRDPRFLKRFAVARRPGTYLRVVGGGDGGGCSRIEVIDRPGHGITIGLFAEAYLGDRGRLVELLAADGCRRCGARGSTSGRRREPTGSRSVRTVDERIGEFKAPRWGSGSFACALRAMRAIRSALSRRPRWTIRRRLTRGAWRFRNRVKAVARACPSRANACSTRDAMPGQRLGDSEGRNSHRQSAQRGPRELRVACDCKPLGNYLQIRMSHPGRDSNPRPSGYEGRATQSLACLRWL